MALLILKIQRILRNWLESHAIGLITSRPKDAWRAAPSCRGFYTHGKSQTEVSIQFLNFHYNVRWIGSFAGAVLLFASSAVGADVKGDALLARVAETLRTAKTLQAEFTITTLTASRYRDTKEQGRVTLARPERVRIDITRFRKNLDSDAWQTTGNGSTVVTDGKVQRTLIRHPGSTQHRSIPAVEGQAGQLLNNLEPLQGFFAKAASEGEARYIGARTWAGEEVELLEVRTDAPAPSLQELYVGHEGLIRQIVTNSKRGTKSVSREVTLHNVRLNLPVSEDVFAVEAPRDAIPFERSAKQSLLSAGTLAPDVTVQGSDGKPVRLSDLRGKIVVLKFWGYLVLVVQTVSTHTQALASKYKDDVVVLAVDIWDSEPAFSSWQRKNRQYDAIRFVIDPRPQGAKDAVATRFQVSATPTQYILGRDGKIVAGFAGYDGPDDTLDRALEAALADKREAIR